MEAMLLSAGVGLAMDLVEEMLRRRQAAGLSEVERQIETAKLRATVEARVREVHQRFDRAAARATLPASDA